MSTILRQAASAVRFRYFQVFLRLNSKIFTGSYRVAYPRLFVDCRFPQRCIRRQYSARMFLIPNTPVDLVQDLYLKELKGYKPAPVVRYSCFYFAAFYLVPFARRRLKMPMSA